MDTAEWAHREMVRRLRAMTPEERLRLVIARVEVGRQIDRLAKGRIDAAREELK